MKPDPTAHDYCVYVIEVIGGEAQEVYVGQSWHPSEVRFEQHRRGEKQARIFRRDGRSPGRLRPDLLPPLERLVTRQLAEAAEMYVAALLQSRGFIVHMG